MNHGCDEYDPNSLTVEQAQALIDRIVEPVSGRERVFLRAALDRVLATDVTAPFDVPPHRNSAMDGYAVRSADLPAEGEARLAVIGGSFAGRPFAGELAAGQAVRIMTGAVVPTGADTVVMQENVQRQGDTIILAPGQRAGDNVRHPGEDMQAGEVVLEAGRRLNAADIGLLASFGIAEIDVHRRPVVAFFSTGDELKGIGSRLGEGDIYDSNRYTLHALLERLPVIIRDMGVIPDDPAAVRAAFAEAAAHADVVITSGGVSVGDADYVKQTLDALGKVDFWKIAMKPGRPLAFGRLGEAVFFGLPGNPVSVMATFILFARPALLKRAGAIPVPPLMLKARTQNRLKKRPGRKDYQRGILAQADDGTLAVDTTGLQGSHVLSSMSRANCFIALPRESGDVEAGEWVEVIPFAGLF
ncbi:MAG: molybdopterin molybdotransferase MoeA [Chromatiales bacterium]|nr:molybdopterin molybdotransferase MoeA [Chromatiales bacterium]